MPEIRNEVLHTTMLGKDFNGLVNSWCDRGWKVVDFLPGAKGASPLPEHVVILRERLSFEPKVYNLFLKSDRQDDMDTGIGGWKKKGYTVVRSWYGVPYNFLVGGNSKAIVIWMEKEVEN